MQGKIALEEHFAIPETLADSRGYFPDRVWQEVKSRVLDLHERRLKLMDQHGIETMLLSLNAPAIQAIPEVKRADEIARKSNDYLAEQVRKRPDRFAAFAALPMQDPDAAIIELTRCVKELGMVGAFIGWAGVLFTMFVGSILGSIGGVAYALSGGAATPPEEQVPAAIAEVTGTRRGDLPAPGTAGVEASLLRTEVPFGPFLALAAATYALFQPQLNHWYLS